MLEARELVEVPGARLAALNAAPRSISNELRQAIES